MQLGRTRMRALSSAAVQRPLEVLQAVRPRASPLYAPPASPAPTLLAHNDKLNKYIAHLTREHQGGPDIQNPMLNEELLKLRNQVHGIDAEIRIFDQKIRVVAMEKPKGGFAKYSEFIRRYRELKEFREKVLEKRFGDLMLKVAKCSSCDAKDVRLVLDNFAEFFVPNAYHFNILIGAFGRMGLVDLCFEALEEMKDYDIPLDSFTYSKMIYICVTRGRYQDALSFYRQMLNSNYQPDATVLSSLIKGAIQVSDKDSALTFTEELLKLGECLDISDLQPLMVLLGAEVFQERWQRIENTMMKLHRSVENCSYLLQFYLRRGKLQRAEQVLKEMELKNIQPSESVGVMLSNLRKAHRPAKKLPAVEMK